MRTAHPLAAHAVVRTGCGVSVPVLYGGSVKADNTAALMAKPDVDGALVGGASLDADSFVKIVERSRG